MKKILLSVLGLLTCGASWAALGESGYYRVNNYKSGRYIYVYDDKGSLDYGATKADMGAIQLWKNLERTITDPASVIYVDKRDNKFCDFQSQGTGVHEIIGVYVQIWDRKNGNYLIGATHSGITKYLCDSQTDLEMDKGVINDNGKGEWRYWNFTPIDADTENYFGVKPEIQLGADYYTTLYAAFPFSFKSEGMTAYTVSKVENGMAVMKEVEGTVPAETPVVIKCSTADATTNRLNIGGTGDAVSTNLLKGVYFNNSSKAHNNQTRNDKATMRVLGVMSNGQLGFVTYQEEFLPANRSYLKVTAGTPAELPVVTEEEYAKSFATVTVRSSSTDAGTVYIGTEGTTSKDVKVGDKLTLVAKAAQGYSFTNWTLDGNEVSTSATYEITVTGSADYVANFKQQPRLYIATTGEGSVKVSTENKAPESLSTLFGHGDVLTAEEGTTLYFYLLPEYGKMVSTFTINGQDLDTFSANGQVSDIENLHNGKKVAFTLGSEDVNSAVSFSVDAAVDSVGSDAADAPAEYFNLQGVRVNSDSLVPGIYVRRTGSKVEKVYVK